MDNIDVGFVKKLQQLPNDFLPMVLALLFLKKVSRFITIISNDSHVTAIKADTLMIAEYDVITTVTNHDRSRSLGPCSNLFNNGIITKTYEIAQNYL